MDCKEITDIMIGIKGDNSTIDRNIGTGNYEEASLIQSAIDHKCGELIKELDPLGENEARRILGIRFIGTREIEEIFNVILDKSQIPHIPYDRESLEEVKRRDDLMVILMLPFRYDGRPFAKIGAGAIIRTQRNNRQMAAKIEWCKAFQSSDLHQLMVFGPKGVDRVFEA